MTNFSFFAKKRRAGTQRCAGVLNCIEAKHLYRAGERLQNRRIGRQQTAAGNKKAPHSSIALCGAYFAVYIPFAGAAGMGYWARYLRRMNS